MDVGLVLAALVIVAGTLTWTGWVGPFALLALCGLWLRVNHSMEGRTLLVLTHEHGVTAGDLAGVAGAVVAVIRLAVLARDRLA